MSKSTYPLKLPKSIKDAAARLARDDGVSLNQWIASAVSQKVGAAQTAARFLEERRSGSTGEGMIALLDRVADVEPDPRDRLPDKAEGRP